MVAVPALVSGGMAIAAGIGGATLTGIVGGVTTIAGVGTGLFASAEIQQASGNGNWMLDAGMSEDWYNGLMLTVASIATLGTFALSFCYSFNIKSLDKIGRLVPSNHPDKGYWGVRFKNARGALRSVNSESCPSWIAFPAQFLESNAYVSKYNKEMDMVFNKNIEKSQIEEFESECLNKVLSSSMFTFLKKQLIKKKYNFKIEVQRSEIDLNKYLSYLVIDIFNEKGERLCEYDEPNCCLMLCESLCFIHNGHIVGIDLSIDEHFLESLKLLIKQIDKSVRFD